MRNLILFRLFGIVCLLTFGCQKAPPVEFSKPESAKPKEVIKPSASTMVTEPKESQPVAIPKVVEKKIKPRTIHAEEAVRSDEDLKAIGVHRFDSKTMRLYTDIPGEQAKELPGLVDQLLPVWKNYFFRVSQKKTASVFPLTGYVIVDQDLFVQSGLLPESIQLFEHGDVLEGRFWMKQQQADYYRRHLLLHEATHCFMTSMPNGQPLWYLEGMAEFFAVHRIDEKGAIQFGVIPQVEKEFAGFGRIATIHREIDQGRFLPIRRIRPLRHEHFLKFKAPYAWSWALCVFLDGHPRYQKRFREIGQLWSGNEFQNEFSKWLNEEGLLMEVEWAEFAHHLIPGMDLTRFGFTFLDSKMLKNGQAKKLSIQADKGWQSTGVRLEASKEYQINAIGQFTVAQKPKPWISEPQGVRIRYVNGQPLGQLQGMILSDSPLETIPFEVISIGREKKIIPKKSGTLFLKINDSYAERNDNSGSVQVTIQGK